MKIATLEDLLTQQEMDKVLKLQEMGFFEVRNGCEIFKGSKIQDLRVKQLSIIALPIFRTEFVDRVPDCIMSAKCIEILTRRAHEKGFGIYD